LTSKKQLIQDLFTIQT